LIPDQFDQGIDYLVTLEQAAFVPRHIQQCDDVNLRNGSHPMLEFIQLTRSINSANERTHGTPRNRGNRVTISSSQ
jgi:hypothetical protein